MAEPIRIELTQGQIEHACDKFALDLLDPDGGTFICRTFLRIHRTLGGLSSVAAIVEIVKTEDDEDGQ